MLMPSIFGENLFNDDWMNFGFPEVEKALYGKHASHQSNRRPACTQHFLEGHRPCPRVSLLLLSSCPQADTADKNST